MPNLGTINTGSPVSLDDGTASPTFVDVNATGAYKVDGTQVLTNQQAAIADASGGLVQDTQARAAINSLLAALRTHGTIAT